MALHDRHQLKPQCSSLHLCVMVNTPHTCTEAGLALLGKIPALRLRSLSDLEESRPSLHTYVCFGLHYEVLPKVKAFNLCILSQADLKTRIAQIEHCEIL